MSEKSKAPQSLTMDRLGERNELIVAQTTSQCCRMGCCQPSINWLIAEGNNYDAGTNPFSLDSVGWIHEESPFWGRCLSMCSSGLRQAKYVQHVGAPPDSLKNENKDWCSCQYDEYPENLSEADRTSNVVLIHEKEQSCGVGFCWFPCLCNGCNLPYLETKDGNGKTLGRTQYVCDMCCFVPKYDVFVNATDGKNDLLKYKLRPDTCVAGLCVRCRCGGEKGKCCRVPYLVRDPNTGEPIGSDATTPAGKTMNSMVDTLWTGWSNECCAERNSYHVTFPSNVSPEEKAVLIGSTLLVDVTCYEQDDE